MFLQGRYGVAFAFEAPIIKAGSDSFAVSGDWTPATGDVKVSKAGGNVADIASLPTAVGGTGSRLWAWALSAGEMESTRATIQVVDAAVKDQAFVVVTLPPGALAKGKASAGGAATITIGTGHPVVPGSVIELHGGTGAGQSLYVLSYAAGVATMENPWVTQPDSTTLWTLWPAPVAPATTLPIVHAQTIEDGAISAATLDPDVTTELQAGLATAAALDTVDNLLDTEVATLLSGVSDIQSRLPAALIGGRMNSDTKAINSVPITGAGVLGNEFDV